MKKISILLVWVFLAVPLSAGIWGCGGATEEPVVEEGTEVEELTPEEEEGERAYETQDEGGDQT